MGYLEIARKKIREMEEQKGAAVNPEPATSTTDKAAHDQIRAKETEQRRDIPADSPLKPGWVVSYRGATGQIRGGTVKAGRRHGGVWAFELEDGTALPEGQILSVARVEGGRWLAAWTVKDWGLDGARLFAER